MMITADNKDGVTVLGVLAPRLDASVAPDLRAELLGRIEGGVQSLVLDLSAVTFMDSSALGALIAAVKRIGPTGSIAIAGSNAAVQTLFSLTRMDKVFPMFPTVHDAVTKLAA